MKIWTAAIALAIATPVAAFDNHEGHGEGHGEDHAAMMCCEGTAEEREACHERHRAMGHEMADCEAGHGDHNGDHGSAAHESHEMGDTHAEHSDTPPDDE